MVDTPGSGPFDETQASAGPPPPPTAIPNRIGPYTVRRMIASGGMGAVYECQQENPRRSVAVKVMRASVMSASSRRRFEYESQLLARLRHPGIAQVYEAGTYDDGGGPAPYFAMEYIPNAKPITQYADEKKLGVRDRLELFARVCDAAHHGHQKGIIHRDLKPGNILVDPSGQPRIIDFGVARATDSDLAMTAFQTEVGQIIGSLQYMSPEQFDADPSDLDTRSDVYALGVVLYELLAGRLPYDVTRTQVYDAAKVVRDTEPPRLGTVRPEFRGDLETIVHTALAKDRDRRYQSAFGLAQDIRRFLGGEAIAARPPTLTYQVRVFARRHKGLIWAVSTVFVVLLGAVAVSSSLYFQARRERARAEAQAAKAERATGFLQEMLENAVPHDYSQEVTLVEWLDQTAGKLDGALPDDPGTEADLHVRLANAYGNLDRDDAVLAQLEAARDAAHRAGDPVQESGILAMLGQFDQILGKLAEAAAAWRGAVDLRTAALGPEDKTTLEANASLVVALMDQGIYPEAEERARATLDARRRLLGEDNRSTLESALQVAALRMLLGDVAGSEERSRQVLDISRNKLGPDEPLTRNAMSQLAAAYLAQGKVDDAAAIYGHRRIPDNLGIEYAFQGPPGVDHKGTQLLVFWETWCPFSQRALPRLETMVQEHPEDIDVVGITSVWGSATDDKVRRFIADKGITYPILKIDHTAARALGQIGTPWGILAENGEVVWQDLLDTPNVFSGVMLEGLLAHLDE